RTKQVELLLWWARVGGRRVAQSAKEGPNRGGERPSGGAPHGCGRGWSHGSSWLSLFKPGTEALSRQPGRLAGFSPGAKWIERSGFNDLVSGLGKKPKLAGEGPQGRASGDETKGAKGEPLEELWTTIRRGSGIAAVLQQ